MTTFHDAPPVIYPVGRLRFLTWCLLGLGLAGIVLYAVWVARGGLDGWRVAAAGAGVLLADALAWDFWRRQPAGDLRWDGTRWWLRLGSGSDSATVQEWPGNLSVHLDLQRYLLLALDIRGVAASAGAEGAVPGRGRSRRYWLWVDAAAHTARWHGLRCAVYSRANTDASTKGGGPNT